MPRPPRRFNKVVSIRLSDEEATILADLHAVIPVVSQSVLARVALGIGLRVLREQPARLITKAPRKPRK